jgi:S1-C subfamily serine protease
LHLEAREVRAVSLGKPVPAAPRARAGSILSKLGLAAALAFATAAGAQERPAAPAENAAASVVAIKTFINPDARTMQNLGRERQGSGVVIDASGLVLTIGYLMVEAYAAEVTTSDGRTLPANIIGYDHESGFGLIQAIAPLKVAAMGLGKSSAVKTGDIMLIAGSGGLDRVAPARVLDKREFAGSWEYLLDEAFFTSPPYREWSGAALVNREGKLVGIGSLIVGDARGDGSGIPGNMFVPIDLLPPILADLIADGRTSAEPKPWLGLTINEAGGQLVVGQVAAQGPGEKAGIRKGDIITEIGGKSPRNLADFYRSVRALGKAGANVPLEIERGGATSHVDVKSMNRMDHLKLKTTL